jgi:hypothetical protein
MRFTFYGMDDWDVVPSAVFVDALRNVRGIG